MSFDEHYFVDNKDIRFLLYCYIFERLMNERIS